MCVYIYIYIHIYTYTHEKKGKKKKKNSVREWIVCEKVLCPDFFFRDNWIFLNFVTFLVINYISVIIILIIRRFGFGKMEKLYHLLECLNQSFNQSINQLINQLIGWSYHITFNAQRIRLRVRKKERKKKKKKKRREFPVIVCIVLFPIIIDYLLSFFNFFLM